MLQQYLVSIPLDNNFKMKEKIDVSIIIPVFNGSKFLKKTIDSCLNQTLISKIEIIVIDDCSSDESEEIINYPNPFSSSTTIVLSDPSQFINIQVFDLLGRIVDAQKINMTNTSYKAKYNAPRLSMGIYKYRLMNDQNKIHSGTFIIK